ncbi:MAG: YdeI/OmpD-associated family protein [Cytophagaceae bacterium]
MQLSEKWAEELNLLASIICKAPLEKTIKWGAEVFTYNNRNVISYGGFKNYFALWFFNGVFLKDKYKVLVTSEGGNTKSLRQWRFTSIEEVNEKKILEYIKEAIDVEKKGLKIQPEKFKPVPVPALMKEEFNKNKKLKAAFDSLTPGRQKEYILYLNEAKQDATKLKRLEKVIPMILEGVGLYDKYK